MYCPKCGMKIASDARFCENCGEKVADNNEKTKFCKYCGEKINLNAEICPKCGVRLENSFHNKVKKATNSIDSKKTKSEFKIPSFFKGKTLVIIILIIIIITLVACAPKIIDALTPYKEVDSTYISNPVPFEKVSFTGEYVGYAEINPDNWNFFSIHLFDVVKVGDQYVAIRDNNLNMNLKKGDVVHLEGKFSEEGGRPKYFNGQLIETNWFAPDNYKIIS